MAPTTRPRPASALLAGAVLVGLLWQGAALAHQGAKPPPRHGLAAPPLHARQFLVGDQDAERGATLGGGRRPEPAGGGWVAVVATVARAAPGSRPGLWRARGAACLRGRPRLAWSRAPPSHLQLA
jgi:hypothetical protein